MSTNPVTITAPEGVPFIEIERDFDAPLEAVYRAYREPELVRQWIGPYGYEMKIERWDLRTEGGYRYIHVNQDGQEFTSTGSFTLHERTTSLSRPLSSRASLMSSAWRRSACRTWATDGPAWPSTALTPASRPETA
jgi:hypothetical protein